jgi:hypothetical protein
LNKYLVHLKKKSEMLPIHSVSKVL